MQLIDAALRRVVTASSTVARRLARDDAGQTMVLLAAALLGMIGVMASVIDVAIRAEEHRQLQNAVDAASLAAASQLPSTSPTAR